MPPEPTEGTTAPPATTTSAPATVAPAAQPVQASPPPAAQPPAGQPAYDPSDVYDDDGKKWKDRFHGYTGALSQQRQQMEAREKELLDQIQALQSQIESGQTQASTLQTQLADLRAQAELIPTLNDQITQLQAAQAQHGKLAIMLEYPQLLGLSVKETVTGEDGTQTEVSHNPVRRLIESSTLEGDALRRQIEQLALLYQVSATPVQQPQGYNSPTAPAPAGPVEETVEAWRAKAMQLHRELVANQDYSTASRERLADAWRKVNELAARRGGD